MGRAPCCDKANVKRGPWSPEEDSTLKAYIEKNGTGGNWIALPQKIGLRRCGKSCRLRWLNYLRPNIRHGGFSEEEDNIICSLYISIGSRWSIIAAQLPGRTDNDIKNYWNTRLKKKLLGKQRKEQQARRASFLRQEMKRETGGNFMVPNDPIQAPYWPVVPLVAMPTTTTYTTRQDPCFEEQESIKTLLIKLGGRFSDDDYHQPNNNISTNFPYPIDPISCIQEQLYGSSINTMLASSTSTNSINNTCTQQLIENNYYDINGTGSPNMFFDVGLSELDELLYGIPQGSNELEGLGIEMINGASTTTTTTTTTNGTPGTSSTESASWGEESSLVFPPMLVNLEAFQPAGVLQNPTFDKSRYYVGPQ